jgi:hypothetical protein
MSGAAVVVQSCVGSSSNPDFSELWAPGPGGQLVNLGSGRCLSAPDGAGTVRQEDCYGTADEVWGLN